MIAHDLRSRLINLGAGLVVSALLAYVIWYLVRQDFRYDFLTLPFASDIGGGFLKLNSSDHVWLAALKGVGNTLMLVSVGILVATALGLVVGIARLSSNPLVAGLARLYVEVLRNVPLLVLMFLFAFVVFAGLPSIKDSGGIPGVVLVSNRGVALPQLIADNALAGPWAVLLVAIAAGAVWVGLALRRRGDDTGRHTYPWLWAALAGLLAAAVSYVLLRRPVHVLPPVLDQSGLFPSYSQGFVLGLGYLSALLAISLYFGAFIAEIVRGSIQAIPREQSEAAASLGLHYAQRLRLVILPQALRIMIPSLNNEYQNANKDSSLAHLITYSEVVFVALQIANNRGNLIELFLAVFVVYVVINLAISTVMNSLNRMVQVVS